MGEKIVTFIYIQKDIPVESMDLLITVNDAWSVLCLDVREPFLTIGITPAILKYVLSMVCKGPDDSHLRIVRIWTFVAD